MKKLYRSEKDSLVAGIIGGIGEYFNVDPTILRLGFVVLLLITGIFPGIVAYIIAYFIMPDQPWEGEQLAVGNMQKGAKEKKEVKTVEKLEIIVTPPPAPKPTPESKLKELIEEKKNGHSKPIEETAAKDPQPFDLPDQELNVRANGAADSSTEDDSGLKKPQWPTISQKSKVESQKGEEEIKTTEIEYPSTFPVSTDIQDPEMASLDSLLDEDYDREADLNDVIDE